MEARVRRSVEFIRNIVGFVIAPAAGLAAVCAMTLVLIPFWGALALTEAWTIAIGLPVAYALAFAVGVPVQIALIMTGRTTLRAYMVAGFCAGVALAPLAWWGIAFVSGTPVPLVVLGVIDLVFGAPAMALAFWLIARPDRSAGP